MSKWTRIYHPDFAKRVRRYALLGMSADEARTALACSAMSWASWRRQYPEFATAWDFSVREANGQVVAALHKRAVGFTKRGLRKPMAHKGAVVSVEYDEYFPPDVTAGLAWMRVHDPDKWGKSTPEPKHPTGRLSLPAGVSIVVDADTLALSGLEVPDGNMRDITPAIGP